MANNRDNPRSLPSQHLINSFLLYEADTGKLFWRENVDNIFFPDLRASKIWHSKYSGKEAFASRHACGYKVGGLRGGTFLAHRIIAAILFGEIGDNQVDHINGERDDNRAINLRLVSHADNMKNSSIFSHNTSGYPGVVWHKRNQKWGARIKVDQRSIHIGLYNSIDEAIEARKLAEKKFGFHPNHGRPSRAKK